jgi:translation elongation factor EF-Tu-like GTPase
MIIDAALMRGCCGLYIIGPRLLPVPLRHSRVLAKLVDFSTEVELTQTYRNANHQPIEAVFIFPLDERSAVCGFEVTVDGKVTKGVVKEKQEARQTYERALQQGDSAQLLEQKRADVF